MIAHVRNSGVLYDAMYNVSQRFEGNVRFKREPEFIGKDRQGRFKYRFTLTVKSSSGPGARRGVDGRAIAAACWHVHGYFFDRVFLFDGEAMIEAGKLKMKGPEDNWQDRNIGSQMKPLLFSDACECEE